MPSSNLTGIVSTKTRHRPSPDAHARARSVVSGRATYFPFHRVVGQSSEQALGIYGFDFTHGTGQPAAVPYISGVQWAGGGGGGDGLSKVGIEMRILTGVWRAVAPPGGFREWVPDAGGPVPTLGRAAGGSSSDPRCPPGRWGGAKQHKVRQAGTPRIRGSGAGSRRGAGGRGGRLPRDSLRRERRKIR